MGTTFRRVMKMVRVKEKKVRENEKQGIDMTIH
jgi:hypothetical protein